jgi:hypothetical protein
MADERWRSGRAAVGALGLLGAAVLGACAAPQLTVSTKQPHAALFVDGRAAGTGTVATPLPYYGTLAASAVRPRPADRPEEPIGAVRAALRVPEPVSPWLFPLDFVLEVASAPFRTDRHEFVLDVPREPSTIVAGLEPPRLEELRLRAAQARVQR